MYEYFLKLVQKTFNKCNFVIFLIVKLYGILKFFIIKKFFKKVANICNSLFFKIITFLDLFLKFNPY